ncbi:putative nucleotidyltransferase [Pedobacter sp. UYP30]|uniref:nucleotidyltransferase domain-containing protein n=1 Tax=Pedobacter sp. UYP30 TaxID=1756400 RepID=UPI00339690A0
MRQEIDNLFKDIDEIPLFYIESGSRLWGIASPDSDYDVRGFHLQSKKQYFDFKKHRDIIEVMDGDFDFVSYDIDKMFGLLLKSNPTVFEWIRANIIYFNELPDWTNFRQDVITNFDFKALFHHYISLAKGNINLMETGKKFTYKTAFYCIRGLLSADLATRQIIPELLIDDLFKQFDNDNDVLKIAKETLDRKKSQKEKEEVIESDKQKILNAIKEFTSQLAPKEPNSSNKRQKLESVLTDYSFNLKMKFYV